MILWLVITKEVISTYEYQNHQAMKNWCGTKNSVKKDGSKELAEIHCCKLALQQSKVLSINVTCGLFSIILRIMYEN